MCVRSLSKNNPNPLRVNKKVVILQAEINRGTVH